MNRMKKLLTLTIVAILVIGTVAGCSCSTSSQSTNSSTPKGGNVSAEDAQAMSGIWHAVLIKAANKTATPDEQGVKSTLSFNQDGTALYTYNSTTQTYNWEKQDNTIKLWGEDNDVMTAVLDGNHFTLSVEAEASNGVKATVDWIYAKEGSEDMNPSKYQ